MVILIRKSVALLGKDDLLIASEQGATYPFDWNFPFFHIPEWFVIPSLIHVNGQGQLVGKYHFPDYYSNDSIWFDFWKFKWHSDDPNRKGVKRNKGIESLDRFKGSYNYLAITEGPLLQDSKDWDKNEGAAPSRLIYFSVLGALNGRSSHIVPNGEYFYQQWTLPESLTENAKPGYPRRGVTDLQIVDGDNALVLERNFIKYKDDSKKSVTDVYRVKLWSSINFARSPTFPRKVAEASSGKVLQKELIFRSSDFEKAFPKISSLNMEGLTFGPDFEDGSKLLIMTNDNGASDRNPAPTYLLFFKVPVSLLTE